MGPVELLGFFAVVAVLIGFSGIVLFGVMVWHFVSRSGGGERPGDFRPTRRGEEWSPTLYPIGTSGHEPGPLDLGAAVPASDFAPPAAAATLETCAFDIGFGAGGDTGFSSGSFDGGGCGCPPGGGGGD